PADPPSPDDTPTVPPPNSANAVTLPFTQALTADCAPRVVGDYEMLAEIARGAMGVVFKARQRSVNRVVALKMILSGGLAGPGDVQRFRVEAEAAANLDHPHILPVYEVGEHDGRPFFSMKLADGGTLAERVPDLVQHPRAAAELVAKLARAVHHAHQRGILHRDLKPANVLLDAGGEPLVADFGLAKRTDADSGVTQSGAIVGTPSYMAPEQARGSKAITTAADVYALGAILYELLAGRPPFQAATVMETVLQVLERPPDHPRAANPRADRDLSAVALKCLEKDPADRYESAAALADDLDRWLASEPTKARPLSPPAQAWRWLKRHTTAAITLPALGLVLGIWPALAGEVDLDVRPDLLPAALDTPLGWYRLLRTVPGLYALTALISAVLFLGFGWLVVRVARPTTTARSIGFAAAVAALAAVVQVVFTAPVLMEQGRTAMAEGGDRVHPVADADPDHRWLAEAARPGTEAHAEAEYLKQFLPPEKQAGGYPEWEQDLRRLRRQAASANRLRAGYRAIGEELIYGLVGTIVWAVYSTWVVMYLDRAYGRRWANFVRYAELTWTAGLAAATLLIAVPFTTGSENLAYMWVSGGYFIALAVVAWVAVVRRWRWWVRWGLYVALTVALGVVAAVLAIAHDTA
ncbi:MAG TPA: serine/threonine-protein kinase, partial [Gemmataceae bacterium]|nr:serine/threonine-protein kinase [Gemmataceae bacterium]